ncbi:hypothetical protein C0J52_19850 [Blattella germanica]|nr:hypothetical protein C0J52_19850 [Blattella germanica]
MRPKKRQVDTKLKKKRNGGGTPEQRELRLSKKREAVIIYRSSETAERESWPTSERHFKSD